MERDRIVPAQDRREDPNWGVFLDRSRDRFRGVTRSFWGRIAAGSGSRIAPGPVPGRGRIVLGQDRSGIIYIYRYAPAL